jgi:hypothetical protein
MLNGIKIIPIHGNTAIQERLAQKEDMKWNKFKREYFMLSLKTNTEGNLVWRKLLSG